MHFNEVNAMSLYYPLLQCFGMAQCIYVYIHMSCIYISYMYVTRNIYLYLGIMCVYINIRIFICIKKYIHENQNLGVC